MLPVLQSVPVSFGKSKKLLVGLVWPIRLIAPLAAVEPLKTKVPVRLPVAPKVVVPVKVLALAPLWV